MEKYLNKKSLGILLSLIIIVIFNLNVYATEIQEMDLKVEEKIMKYDAITGETTEVNLKDLNEAIRLEKSENISNSIPSNINKSIFTEDNFYKFKLSGVSAVKVKDATIYPYNATCRLKYISNEEEHIASAALVGKNIALTAAHCVFEQKSKVQHENWTIYPGFPNVRLQEGASCGWSEVYYSSKWMNNSAIDLEHDWAICILEKNLGEMLGAWYGATTFENTALLFDKDIRLLGYPCDKNYMFDGNSQYEARGIINNASNYCIYPRNLLVAQGFSGGPITDVNNAYILAIYVGREGISKIPTGVRITQEMINIIKSYK